VNDGFYTSRREQGDRKLFVGPSFFRSSVERASHTVAFSCSSSIDRICMQRIQRVCLLSRGMIFDLLTQFLVLGRLLLRTCRCPTRALLLQRRPLLLNPRSKPGPGLAPRIVRRRSVCLLLRFAGVALAETMSVSLIARFVTSWRAAPTASASEPHVSPPGASKASRVSRVSRASSASSASRATRPLPRARATTKATIPTGRRKRIKPAPAATRKMAI
jgi:hypothetical protein